MITKQRFILSTFMAWLLFLMLDFLAHAGLLNALWAEDFPALKPKEDLFRLIPFGYLSFLILILLVGWLYVRHFNGHGGVKKGLIFGMSFGLLFALSISLGLYSFINLPFIFLLAVSLVYFVEISAVGLVYGFLLHPASIKKRVWGLFGIIFMGILLGIVLQNMFS
jgi:hypothetical protein